MTSALTGIHILCLFSVALWFLCQLYKGHSWAQLLIGVAKVLRHWADKITISIKSAPSKIESILKLIRIKYEAMVTTYRNKVHLRRNINWYNYQFLTITSTDEYFAGRCDLMVE